MEESYRIILDHLQGKRVEKHELARNCIASITTTTLLMTSPNPTYTDYVREPQPLPALSQGQMIEAIEWAIEPGYGPMLHATVLRTCLAVLERQFC